MKKQDTHVQRLDRWIASQGSLSRKQVRELVRAGLVTVNGTAAKSADAKVSESDEVVVNGQRLAMQKHAYIMLNKPAGVLCATEDRKTQTVLDLLPEELYRPGLFPCGRLDKDTEGFVLLTNDGPFAHSIMAPKRRVPKTYYARLNGAIHSEALTKAFAEGVDLGDGDRSSPAELTVLQAESPAEAELVIYEGMYHQVKRMFARYGLTVTYLKRLKIGNLELDPQLCLGEARMLRQTELALFW